MTRRDVLTDCCADDGYPQALPPRQWTWNGKRVALAFALVVGSAIVSHILWSREVLRLMYVPPIVIRQDGTVVCR